MVIDWGEGNVLILTPAYQQIMVPEALRFADIEPDDVFVLKTRAHFRDAGDEHARRYLGGRPGRTGSRARGSGTERDSGTRRDSGTKRGSGSERD